MDINIRKQTQKCKEDMGLPTNNRRYRRTRHRFYTEVITTYSITICLESNKHGIIFASVVIDENIGIGDCLTVTSNSQRPIFYWASRCDLQLFQICSTGEYLVDYLLLENLI